MKLCFKVVIASCLAWGGSKAAETAAGETSGPVAPPPAEPSQPTDQASRDVEFEAAGKNFVGAFIGARDGARYFVDGIHGPGRVLIYRIAPDNPYSLFLGNVKSGTRIAAEGIGGTKGTLIIEFKDGVVRVESTLEKGEEPVRDELTRDKSAPDSKSYFARYFGMFSKRPAATGGGEGLGASPEPDGNR